MWTLGVKDEDTKEIIPFGNTAYVSVNYVVMLQTRAHIFVFPFMVVDILIQSHSFLESLTLQILITYYMEQTPSSEANRFPASQEIPRILCNPTVHYHIHKFPPPVPVVGQLDPVQTITSHFVKILPNITILSTSGSPKCSLTLTFPNQNPVYASRLPHTRYMPCRPHSLNSTADRNVDDRFRARFEG